jgi:hypothetical protein
MERSSDTGGLFYPKAMQHVFVGLYINEVRGCNIVDMRILMHDVQICLFALFLLARDPVAKKQIAIPEAIIMLLLILFTVSCCQTLIGPQLTLFLPGILPVDNQRLIWSSDQPVATDTCGQSFLRPTLRRSWWSGGCCRGGVRFRAPSSFAAATRCLDPARFDGACPWGGRSVQDCWGSGKYRGGSGGREGKRGCYESATR